MIGYLGVPGGLAELKYRGGLSTATDRPVRLARTMGGKRKAMLGPVGRREWDVSFDLIGSRDTHGLVAAAQSGGPLMWYPADAVAGNLMTPQAAGFAEMPENAVAAGLVHLPDGTVASAVAHSGTGNVSPVRAGGVYDDVPVRSGEQVTVSGWGFGGIRFTGFWRDAIGGASGSWATSGSSFTGWGWRSQTLTVPAGVSFLRLSLSSASQYARPSVAWGAQGMDRPGRGCAAAVVHGLSEALTVISGDDAYGSISVTITEVG